MKFIFNVSLNLPYCMLSFIHEKSTHIYQILMRYHINKTGKERKYVFDIPGAKLNVVFFYNVGLFFLILCFCIEFCTNNSEIREMGPISDSVTYSLKLIVQAPVHMQLNVAFQNQPTRKPSSICHVFQLLNFALPFFVD